MVVLSTDLDNICIEYPEHRTGLQIAVYTEAYLQAIGTGSDEDNAKNIAETILNLREKSNLTVII